MRRTSVLALALALPAAAIVGGSAAASTPSAPMHSAPTTSTASSPAAGSSMAGMDMSSMPMAGSAAASKPLRAPTKANTIKGVVGPDYGTIEVSPETVAAGTYRLVVQDYGTNHNFHIIGPGGVDEKTSVSGTGKTVWKLTLVKGTYKIRCDPHRSYMKTTLTVT